MTNPSFDLETAVATWRQFHARRRAFLAEDLDELERHLRDHTAQLVAKGLDEETAFRTAVHSLGDLDGGADEYGKVYWGKLKRRGTRTHELRWRLAMLNNYLKIALRNLKRHPGSSLINVSGLAIGMACCLVILLFIHDELRVDAYHEKADQIYRLSLTTTTLSSGDSGPVATSSILWAPTMQREYGEVLDYARFVRLVGDDTPWELHHGDKTFAERNLLYADPAALCLFSWPLRHGDPATALTQPRSIVLTETMATRYFGNEDPMGQLLSIDPKWRAPDGMPIDTTLTYTVTGVLADVPRTSHFTFDFLLSFIDLNDIYGADVTTGENMDRWFWRGRIAHTYLLLRPDADPAALEARFPDFLERYIGDETRSRGYTYDLFLQPLSSLYLDGDFSAQLEPVGNMRTLYMFSIIAGFILLIACINFMNLATAQSVRRAKEVGMRKVAGARRPQLVAQFLGESILISLVALVLAVGLARLILPLFYQYIGKDLVFDYASLFFVVSLIGLALFVGIVAGSYPAFFLSRFAPATVLKGTVSEGPRGGLLRKGLVVFQFAISAFLIIGTITVFQQLQYMRSQDLGFDQERVLVLPPNVATGLKPQYDVVKAELLQHPQVADVTISSAVPGGAGGGDIYNERGMPADEGIGVGEAMVDDNFVDFYGLELLAGRDFSQEFTSDLPYIDETGQRFVTVLLNEEAVRQFGWASPEEALDRQIVRDPRAADAIGTVVGVVRDFHVQSLKEPITPVALILWPDFPGDAFLSARLRPGDLPGALRAVQETTRSFLADAPFEYSFMDENFEAQYASEEQMSEIFTYISLLAIFIACLGLFGLAAFTAEQRTKEIGVRKVLGASVPSLVVLLSKDFLKLVLIACIVALPLGYLAAKTWLEDFAYRIEPGPGIFLLASGLALLIAVLTVSYQAAKAALADPVKSLRYE